MSPSHPKRFKKSESGHDSGQKNGDDVSTPTNSRGRGDQRNNNRGRGRGRGTDRGRGTGRGRGNNFNKNHNTRQHNNQEGDCPNRGRGNFRGQGRGNPGNRGRNSGNERGRPRPEPFIMRPVEQVCTRFIKGRCFDNKEEKCRLGHFVKAVRPMRCKFWIQKQCHLGDNCTFSHNVPCKYFHLFNGCGGSIQCDFNHDPLTELQRRQFIRELNLDLPPKVLTHDFKIPHGKSARNQDEPNPLSLAIQVPKEFSSSKSDLPPTDPADDEPVKAPVQFSLSGFYKDTLDSDEEDQPTNTAAKDSDPKNMNDCPSEASDTDEDHNSTKVEVINAGYDPHIVFHLRPIKNIRIKKTIYYGDIRKAVLLGYTLIDPRLTCVQSRGKPKVVPQVEGLFLDDMELPSSPCTTESPASP